MKSPTDSNRRGALRVLTAAIVVSTGIFGSGVHAETAFPQKPVTIVIAWAAGGGTDVIGRVIQPVFAKKLGADVVIRNVPGASGTIGTTEVANANTDGYTLLISPAGPLSNQPHLREIPYDVDSFDAIGRITITPTMMMVTQDSPFNSLAEVLAAAKERPNSLIVASTGAGTLPHVAQLALDGIAGVKTKHVPFNGSANAAKALLGEVVDIFSDQAQLVSQYELKPLAAWTNERLPDYPDVPTMKELGYDIQLYNWVGMLAPKDLPADVHKQISTALAETMQDAAVIEAIRKLKVQPEYMNPEAFTAFVHNDNEQAGKLLKKAESGGL